MHSITFSRQMGAKGTEIARFVARGLRYDCYDRWEIPGRNHGEAARGTGICPKIVNPWVRLL